jgi:hypothetical protein
MKLKTAFRVELVWPSDGEPEQGNGTINQVNGGLVNGPLKDLAARVDPSRSESELDVDREAWVRVTLMELKPAQIVIGVFIGGSRMVILWEPHR